MLHYITPNPKQKRNGGLTPEESKFAKGLLRLKYTAQDIVYIINQGRKTTINPARITELSKKDIAPATEEEIKEYLKIQSSYDNKTLLNPYKNPRLICAREAMLSAVQIFNNPCSFFKVETFCVLANIAWTYLLHEKLEETEKGRSLRGNKKARSVREIINSDKINPIENKAVCENISKIIDIRDTVEHEYFLNGGIEFCALFQSCCLNFEHYLTLWFGDQVSLLNELSLTLQFSNYSKDQICDMLNNDLNPKIKQILHNIEDNVYAGDTAFKIHVQYTTEVSSKTKSDITQLISYDPNVSTSKTSIKKVNKLDEYPLSYKQVIDSIGEKEPNLRKKDIDKIIKENFIKNNITYAYYAFRNKQQEDTYHDNGIVPKGISSIYSLKVVDFIISHKEKKHD
jgi:hypothetical protein